MLTHQDVGHRITIRRSIESLDGRQRYSDLVGRLVEMTETEIVVSSDRGVVRIPHTAINAARRMPDQRPLSATGQLERVATAGWPAPERAMLGDWILRAAGGWTARANSALPIGRPECPIPDAVDAVVAWYTERGLRSAIMVPEPIGGRVSTELRGRGWVTNPSVLMQTATLDDIVRLASAQRAEPENRQSAEPENRQDAPRETRQDAPRETRQDAPAVRLDAEATAEWLSVIAAMPRGLPAVARDVITGVQRSRFAGVYDQDGSPMAIARGVIAGDDRWLGLSLIEVRPEARRRGLATAVIKALALWAASEGATMAYLQVEERNHDAVALYQRLGFTTHHRYHTWQPDE